MSKARELAELGAVYDSGALSNRNLIINGGFQVFQRATSATAQTDGAFLTADRWLGFVSGGGAYTTQKSTGNTGTISHDTAWKIDVTTADTSLAAGDYYSLVQRIEAQNLQQLAYGTSNAKTLTLSFWVRATKTGTSCICVTKNDNTQYNYVAEYTINASNTWEHKTITIEPDSNIKAANGAITNDNGRGMQVIFVLAYGSNYTAGTANAWNDSADFATTNQINHMDSTSNDFYITGVQLELGTEATPFEHRSFGDELALCQRYYQQIVGVSDQTIIGSGRANGTTVAEVAVPLAVSLRASPTLNSLAFALFGTSGAGASATSTPTVRKFTSEGAVLHLGFTGSGLTNGQTATVSTSSGSTLTMSSEL